MNYSKYIDHTLLKPDCTDEQIKKLCEEAKNYNFASVCVNPGYIKLCASLLEVLFYHLIFLIQQLVCHFSINILDKRGVKQLLLHNDHI